MTKLVCLHHAGGNTSVFRQWAQYAPPGLELMPVALPTSSNSGRSRLHRSTEELIPALAADLERDVGDDFVLFGKSMGGLLAYLLTRHFEQHSARRPKVLAIAAFGAPHVPWGDFAAGHDDDALMTRLHAIGGIPDWLIQHPSWVRPFLGLMRDDARMCAEYRHIPQELPLSVPVRVFAGDRDPLVPRDAFDRWGEVGEDVKVTFLRGGHYLVSEDFGLLRQAIFSLALHGRPPACSIPTVKSSAAQPGSSSISPSVAADQGRVDQSCRQL
ncbi:thioesterase domain-containing protein [Streptomyces angustmyceticus]|uniref:Putative thioesterase n=1 Tax=Streptomyces angustmyceticus TaxID=285578 RepID=A0A5J4LMC9_9ACTN|nr:thioesterase domain-containing protein [Streptomyces angustmyceticus]UAL66010.1 thioesterase II family protein [Streptomyces angustmyceticus]GES33664.1 putative thioesterase [Streptomyces angustmyceticus]